MNSTEKERIINDDISLDPKMTPSPPEDPKLLLIDDDIPNSDLEGELQEWLSSLDDGSFSGGFTATLYKEKKPRGTAVCDQSKDTILSVHEIGMMFGSGFYKYYIAPRGSKENKPLRKRIHIDESYDERRAAAAAAIPPAQSSPISGGLGESLAIMERIAGIFKTMMPVPSPPSNDASMATAMMLKSFEATNSVMKNNLLSNVELFKKLGENMIDNATETEEEETGSEQGGLTKMVLGLAEKYLPVILSPGAESQKTIHDLKSNPMFKGLLKDRETMTALIGAVKKKYGERQCQALLNSLGISKQA